MVYSEIQPVLLKHIVKLLGGRNRIIENWISSSGNKAPKDLEQFWGKGNADAHNSVIIDSDPCTSVINWGNCIPILRYKGGSKDSTLLYLEKYLLDLALYDDLRGKLQNDFGFGITKIKKTRTNCF